MTRSRISAITGQQTISLPQKLFIAIAIEDYFSDMTFRGRPANTQHAYREKLMPFLAWCDTQLITTMDQFTPDIIRAYFNLLALDHNPGGVHGYYRVIRAFFNWWHFENEPDFPNPLHKARMPKPPLGELEPVPNETVSALLSTCRTRGFLDLRDYAILSVLYDTGVRANELLMLDRADVGDRLLHIRFGKGRQIRYTHFGSKTLKALARHSAIRIDNNPCLFIGDYGDRLKYQGLRKIIERRANLSGVEPPPIHSFRRAFAINCLLAGWDVYRLRDEMGLHSMTVLERYLKIVEAMRADLSRMTSPMDRLNTL